jgi:hypothetical protein
MCPVRHLAALTTLSVTLQKKNSEYMVLRVKWCSFDFKELKWVGDLWLQVLWNAFWFQGPLE